MKWNDDVFPHYSRPILYLERHSIQLGPLKCKLPGNPTGPLPLTIHGNPEGPFPNIIGRQVELVSAARRWDRWRHLGDAAHVYGLITPCAITKVVAASVVEAKVGTVRGITGTT